MNISKTYPPIILLFIFFLSLGPSNAQFQKDTLQAYTHFKKGDSLNNIEDYKNAIVEFETAIQLYKSANAWKQVARAHNEITISFLWTSNGKQFLESAQKALEISTTKLKVPNKEQAHAYYRLGKYYYATGSREEAFLHYEKSLAIFKEISLGAHSKAVVVRGAISDIKTTLGKFDEATFFILEAIGIAEKNYELHKKNIGKLYLIYGSILQTTREYDKALKFYNKALKVQIKEYGPAHKNVSAIYNNLGIISYLLLDHDQALSFYRKALEIQLNTLNENHPAIFITTNNIGLVYHVKNEYRKALDYFNKVLEYRLKKFGEKHYYTAPSYNSLGFAYAGLGDLEKSLYYQKKALAIYKNTFTEKHNLVIDELIGIGDIYLAKGEYKMAITHTKEALRINDDLYKGQNKVIYGTHSILGNAYSGLKNYDLALENYEIELNNRIRLYGKNDPHIATALNDIGILFHKKGAYKKALTYYEKALTIIDNEEQLLKVYQSGAGDYLLKTLLTKGNSLLHFFIKDKDVTNLDKSIATFGKAEKRIDTLKQLFTRHEDRLEFSKYGKELYTKLIQAHYLKNKEAKNTESLKKAFYYSEKNHADILTETLSASNARHFSGLSDKIIALENTLKNRRSFYQSQITNELIKKEHDSIALSNYNNKLFSINNRYDSLSNLLKKEYPKYHQLKYTSNILDVKGVQKRLDSKTTLLEYFIADSTVYAFVISKANFQMKKLSVPDLLDKVGQLRKALVEKDVTIYKKKGRFLYQELITPVVDLLTGEKLIIVPDGPLWHLNFDLLLTDDSTSKNPKELPYLLRKYAISYANSANLLFNRPKNTNQKTLNQVLAFSYTDTTALANGDVIRLGALRDTGKDLPGTRKEIRAIANIVDGIYYYGKEAVEANFKKNATNYNIVHLALHGDVDNERPQNSKLYFTKSKDSLEDNLLYAHELFALNIPAELTVLSACNTGTGKIAKGEGIMSLGNAFQYAGTKSLLLSSWEVADDSAPKLMQYFYSNLKKGMDKPSALQQAKLEYLKTAEPTRSNPFYWGNFYLVGNSDPISIDGTFNWYWIGACIALGIIILIFIRMKKHFIKR